MASHDDNYQHDNDSSTGDAAEREELLRKLNTMTTQQLRQLLSAVTDSGEGNADSGRSSNQVNGDETSSDNPVSGDSQSPAQPSHLSLTSDNKKEPDHDYQKHASQEELGKDDASNDKVSKTSSSGDSIESSESKYPIINTTAPESVSSITSGSHDTSSAPADEKIDESPTMPSIQESKSSNESGASGSSRPRLARKDDKPSQPQRKISKSSSDSKRRASDSGTKDCGDSISPLGLQNEQEQYALPSSENGSCNGEFSALQGQDENESTAILEAHGEDVVAGSEQQGGDQASPEMAEQQNRAETALEQDEGRVSATQVVGEQVSVHPQTSTSEEAERCCWP